MASLGCIRAARALFAGYLKFEVPRTATRRVGCSAQYDPRRGVVAGAFLAPDLAIDARFGQPRRELRAQQQMIEPQAGVARPSVALVIPEGEHRLRGVQRANSIGPALRDQRLERGTALRLDQRVVVLRAGWIDVKPGRRDVVIANQRHRQVLLEKFRGMPAQPGEPLELVVEFRPRL